MQARRPAHLTRRGERYYFRVAIPDELSQFFSGREFKLSLQTSDPAKARLRHRRLSYLWEAITQSLAHMAEQQKLPLKKVGVLVQEYFLREVENKSFHAEYGPREEGFEVDAEITDATGKLERLRRQIGTRQYDGLVLQTAQSLIDEAGYAPPPKHADTMDNLCNGLLRAEAEAVRIFIAMLRGNYGETSPQDPLFIEQAAAISPGKGGQGLQSQTVSVLAKRYIVLKGATWAKKTILDNKRVLGWFEQLVGGDTFASEITNEDIRKYRDLLLELPSNYAKIKAFEGLSLTRIVQAAKEKGVQKLSPRTADKYLGMAKGFLEWLRREGYIPITPGKDIAMHYKKEKALDARHPFSLDQLRTIFTSPVYVGHKSPERRYEPGGMLIKDGKYWVPLIALFSGMRLGEIVQLQIKDVREHDGVWLFDVNKDEEAGKSLKTATSKRLVPVHPMLIACGLIDYVKALNSKRKPTERIFSDIEIGADGYASHNFSKYFSRFLKAVGAKKTRTSFHSFRHGFKDAMHVAGIQDSRQNALMGHSNHSAAESYGSGIPPKSLFEDMSRIAFQGLDLSHLQAKAAQ